MNTMHIVKLLGLATFAVVASQDPCDTTNILDDPKRSVAYSLGDSEVEGCDRDLTPGWYKVKDGGNIATSCPSIQRCGATFPVWINGTMPANNGDQTTLVACHVGFFECCDSKTSVDVKHCGNYNVFHLPSLPTCPGRYCTEGPNIRIPCRPGYSSDDGFEPCEEITISFTSVPTIHPYIPTSNFTSVDRSLTFECRLPSLSNLREYFYDIRWIADKKMITEKKLITWQDLKSNGSLYMRDWNQDVAGKLGFRIQCDIRARAYSNSTPSAYISSDQFYAGVEVQNKNYDVQAGSEVHVRVRSTVPVACAAINGRTVCTFRMELYSLEHQFSSAGSQQCNQSTNDDDIKASACAITFDGERWNDWHTMIVSTQTDKASRIYTASVKLRAIASSALDPFWNNYHLPEIKIRVHPVVVKQGRCMSWQDPHILTFDRSDRQVTHVSGEFVLFKHTTKPVEIHTIHKWRGYFEANCAIAVRAAADIFIIYGCTDPIRWITRRLNCDSERQSLEVYERNRGQEFRILLPTGSEVNVIINRQHLNIYIYASAADLGFTQGLCGTYNENSGDDWTMRDGTVGTDFDAFVRSWSVPQAESLFIKKARNEILKTAVLYCSCVPNEDFSGNPKLTEKADCSWRDSLPLCKGLNWNQDLCRIGRKRRAASDDDDDDDIDASTDVVAFKQSSMEGFQWRNGWSETTARSKCEEVLKSSELYGVCSTLENVKNDATIESCVDDIKTTGSDSLLKSVSDTLISQCTYEAQTNTSTWSGSSSESGGLTIKDFIVEKDCPNNCSGIGQCSQGTCQCPSGFTTDDCSVNIDSVPEVVNFTEDSFCGLRQGRSCGVVSIFGSGFYDSGKIQCLIRSAALTDNKIVPGNSTTTVNGDLLSFSEMSCPIGSLIGRRKRSVSEPGSTSAYLISITMNGINYSQPIPMIVYDSSCTVCVVENGIFVCNGRTDICVKEGLCYDLANSQCDDVRDVQTDSSGKNYLWIIGAVLGGIAICIIGVFVTMKAYSRKRQYVSSLPQKSDKVKQEHFNCGKINLSE